MLGGESTKRAFKKDTTFGRNANTEVADILKHKKYKKKGEPESFQVVREAYVDAYRWVLCTESKGQELVIIKGKTVHPQFQNPTAGHANFLVQLMSLVARPLIC